MEGASAARALNCGEDREGPCRGEPARAVRGDLSRFPQLLKLRPACFLGHRNSLTCCRRQSARSAPHASGGASTVSTPCA